MYSAFAHGAMYMYGAHAAICKSAYQWNHTLVHAFACMHIYACKHACMASIYTYKHTYINTSIQTNNTLFDGDERVWSENIIEHLMEYMPEYRCSSMCVCVCVMHHNVRGKNGGGTKVMIERKLEHWCFIIWCSILCWTISTGRKGGGPKNMIEHVIEDMLEHRCWSTCSILFYQGPTLATLTYRAAC